MSKGQRATVVVASSSAARGAAADTTGPVLVAWLRERGFEVDAPIVVADGHPVRFAVESEVVVGTRVVLVTGGTGVSPDDQTPEIVAPLLDVEVPGIIEAIRLRGATSTPHAILTRGVAGFAGNTLIVTLPGSAGGVADGLAVLDPVLEHLLAQRTGAGGHGPRA